MAVALLVRGVLALLACIVGVGLFERFAPRRWVRAYQRNANRFFRGGSRYALGWAVLETTGRRTGLPRQTPMGGSVRDDMFWAVAGDWQHSAFVKNIQADPRVRVCVRGRWREGTAQLVPDDNPRKRLLSMNPVNSLFVLIAARDPMTIRVDFDACGGPTVLRAPSA